MTFALYVRFGFERGEDRHEITIEPISVDDRASADWVAIVVDDSIGAGWYRTAMRRRRGRKELARLDDHLLRDVGLTRHDARRGTGKRR